MAILPKSGAGPHIGGNPKNIIKQRLKTRAVRKRQAIARKAEQEKQSQLNSIGNIDAFSSEDVEIFNDFPMLPIVEKPCKWDESKRNEVMALWCRVLGFFPVITTPSCPTEYVPLAEKKRQLANAATEKQRLKLIEKYGLLSAEESKKKADVKGDLRSGELVLERVLPGRMDTEYSLKAALLMCESRHDAIKPEEGIKPKKDRVALLQKIKEREEQREARLRAKEVTRRKKAMESIAEKRQNKKMKLVETALNSFDKERAEVLKKLILPDVAKKEDTQPSVSSGGDSGHPVGRTAPEQTNSSSPEAEYVFNLPGAVRAPVRTKRKTLEELRAKLAEETKKKKLLTELHQVNEDKLVHEIRNKEGWSEAEKKVIGEKVESAASLSRDIKRLDKHKRNKGKKLEEVLKRQKQAKHQKTVKRLQNLRTRRVDKLAKKMKALKNKGTYVPGFM
ncbi:caldesmon [Hyalella azteca]|uniref:Caldesmon n=1 Tax=Hyalella azteca TaxID=294128 RepID=A0A8B7NH81_HYAAZ|nr:caldesmon [Hyalella azteca]